VGPGPVPGFRVAERSRSGNTPVPPNTVRRHVRRSAHYDGQASPPVGAALRGGITVG
jgi:hypothetical protein